MTEHITVSRELLRQVRVVTQRARYTAMNQTLVARIPESGLFGGIAQDLDFAESKLRAVLEQPVVEPVAEASVLELVDQLKAGAAFPAYPPMPLREAASVLLKQHEEIVQLREALRVSAAASPPADVPLLTQREVAVMWAGESFDTMSHAAYYALGVKRGEQAVRQKAGLK